MSELTMCEVTRENWCEALQLSVSSEQLSWVAGFQPIAAQALAKAYVGHRGWVWVPYVFLDGEAMVGFAELGYESGSSSNYWRYHFFIDQRFQGQGYGNAALQLFIRWVREHHPTCQIVQLTVHPENQRAQHLYLSTGFHPTGTIFEDEPVYQITLHEA